MQDFRPEIVFNATAKVGDIGGTNCTPVDFLAQNIQIQVSWKLE